MAEKRRIRIPIRFKILITVLLVIALAVAIITATMANLFHQDKTASLHDFTSIIALHATTEAEALLSSYQERGEVFSRVINDAGMGKKDKAALLKDLFENFPELVVLRFFEGGVERSMLYDNQSLEAAGLTKEELDQYRGANPLPLEALQPGAVYVENSTILEHFPTLTLVTRQKNSAAGAEQFLAITVRMESLLGLTMQSQAYDIFLLDGGGRVLATRDVSQVAERDRPDWLLNLAGVPQEGGLVKTLEYDHDGKVMVGAFSRTQASGLLVGVQVPKAAANLTSRALLSNLYLVALVLVVGAALLSLVLSRRITTPLERLSRATRSIGQGQFETRLELSSNDEIGELAGSFNQMADELHQRETALRQAQTQLLQSEKMAAFGQLGAGIAHEVKNPLAGILGFAQLALRKVEDGTPLHKHVSIIEKETKRCQQIIEGLLKFARKDGTGFEPCDLNAVAVEAMGIVGHQLGIAKVTLKKDLAPDLPKFKGSGNQLQQVLMNLMLNAQQAFKGEPGQVTLTTALNTEGRLELRVSDNGPGMPPEVQARIFEPFFTTKVSGEGTGLGLSVSFRIIEDHQGQIRVESAPGAGATFVITLPPLAEEEKAAETEDLPIAAAG